MYRRSSNRTRAKTAKLAFPLLTTTDGQDFFQTMNHDSSSIYSQTQNSYSNYKKGYSTLPLPLSMPKGKYRVSTAIPTGLECSSNPTSTLFPYPPIPKQNPKLKLLKSAGAAANNNYKKINYTDHSVFLGKTRLSSSFKNLTRTTTKKDNNNADNNVLRTTVTIPILPHRLDKLNYNNKNSKQNILQPSSKIKGRFNEKIEATGIISGDVQETNSLLCPLIGAKLNENNKEKPGRNSSNGVERFRVNRTDKEREISPDCIRLDKLGLKHFPIIGNEETQLRVLSLQHNSISRLDNLPPLTHLLVLDLYDNRVERITGLHGFTSLKVLLLGKNRIRRIEGLDGLKRLEILDLHGNQLRYVDNLASLNSLRILNLAGNLIRTIRNLGPYGLSALTELNLKRNRIKSLDGLQKAPHIKKLFLANNDLQSFSSLHPLKKLVFLQELLLESNPLSSLLDYNSQILTIFPFLETLDRTIVSDQMRSDAKIWYKQRLAAEEERRKDLEKIHGMFDCSRDEVIFEAKQRWESLKHFVRSKGDQEVPVVYLTDLNTSKVNKPGIQIITESVTNEKYEEPSLSKKLPTIVDEVPSPNNLEIIKTVLDIDNFVDANISKISHVSENIDNSKVSEKFTILPSTSDLNNVNNSKVYNNSDDTTNNSTHPSTIHLDKREQESIQNLPIKSVSNSKLTKVAIVRPLLRSTKTIEYKPPVNPVIYVDDEYQNPLSIENSMSTSKVLQETEDIFQNEYQQIPNKTLEFNNKCPIQLDELSIQTKENVSVVQDCIVLNDVMTQDASFLEIENEKVDISNILQLVQEKSETTLNISKENNNNRSLVSPNLSLRRSLSFCNLPLISNEINEEINENSDDLIPPDKKIINNTTTSLKNWRSSSIDVHFQTGESDTSDIESIATSTNTSDVSSRRPSRKNISKPKWRVKTARQQQPSVTNVSGRRPATCQRDRTSSSSILGNKPLRRVDSGHNLEPFSPPILKRQGSDYLIEIDGKILNIYGQGALKHTLPAFSASITANVTTVNFHFISYDTMIPYFGKIKQFYPALDHFHFRSNNIYALAQLNALSDLQGITSLQISEDGNPLVENLFWKEYAVYRLGHWGLQFVNGKEVVSEYRGGKFNPEMDYKMYDSLGYLALSCLPQTALKPLAKRLHTLHCFCCCSPSSSSDESGKKKTDSNNENSGSICNAWDDDPILLDVIGKEALVYTPHDTGRGKESQDVAIQIINSGQLILEKLDMLEKVWPTMMCEAIQDILTDYMFMDSYMKKGLKRVNDEMLANEKIK